MPNPSVGEPRPVPPVSSATGELFWKGPRSACLEGDYIWRVKRANRGDWLKDRQRNRAPSSGALPQTQSKRRRGNLFRTTRSKRYGRNQPPAYARASGRFPKTEPSTREK